MAPYSYQTFTGVAMYSPDDAPADSKPGEGKSFVKFDLQLLRSKTTSPASLELIVLPDTNIEDIGVRYNGDFRICCDDDLISAHKCKASDKNKLIVKDGITGLQTFDINFDSEQDSVAFDHTFDITTTAIHVFGLASCTNDLGDITFTGTSVWMNPYGHLPGDVYGYLPFYGYMCIGYLVIALIWFCLNALYWKQLLHVQNCITGVLAMCLIEMATWYFDYLHLNTKGIRHHGPFILGLITTVSRRMVARMLTVAVSMGYGVVKPTLGSVKNKIIGLGCIYWIFAFMFEALIHYNQTEKVETWMRVVLIPPVAIINGIFWWWTFVSLNRTIEYLKVRKQSAKLQLYKHFTMVLVIALVAAVGFAIYEMYYVLKELYFAEWERLWFMEVGFWQILFSIIFFTIMILWRPTEHLWKYVSSKQIGTEEDDGIFEQPDTMANDYDSEEDEDDEEDGPAARFTIDDEDDGDIQQGSTTAGNPTDTVKKMAEQLMGDNDEHTQLAAQKMA